MCYIDSHKKQQPSYVDDGSRGGGNALPKKFTTEALVSLITTIDFIDFWLKYFDHNYLARSNMYSEAMQELFKKTPVEPPKPLSHRKKRKLLLNSIGGTWYTKKRIYHPYEKSEK